MSTALVSPADLAAGASVGPGPVVLDVRWRLGGPPGYQEYREGHVPGAVFVDLDRDLSGVPGLSGRHPLPDPDAFGSAMRRAGVSSGRPVVVYDAADSTAAARAWWLLRYFGHQDVRVLDGGFRAWVRAGYPVSTDEGSPLAGDFQPVPRQMPVLEADGAWALAQGSGLLLDARAPERYRGETEPVDAVAGHIPGAVNAPTADNVNPGGSFKDPSELAARFDALGVGAASGAAASGGAASGDGYCVGVYCGSGVTAAHEVLAMEIAGFPAALYVGSWSNWITNPSRPIAREPNPPT